jgi:rRNA maturation endonuclease Nob1
MLALKHKAKAERKIEYQCQQCFTSFCLISSEINCPTCGSHNLGEMVIIYADDDPGYFDMLTAADLKAGD